ncbi:MAG: tetratricopeptide repeat protein [Acidobacteria bacterium]|nr:tetratricopeptide repeat protein [Acidobacteriota bacterium]
MSRRERKLKRREEDSRGLEPAASWPAAGRSAVDWPAALERLLAALCQAPRTALSLAFLLPNLGALVCGFVLDDVPLIVENTRLHSLSNLPEILVSGYWPDRAGIPTYRPVTQTFWAGLWALGHGEAWVFHVFNLLLGLGVVLLVWGLLREIGRPDREATLAALLFALFPIHTEATTSIVGSAELLAASFGLGAILLFRRGGTLGALLLLALSVFSKESGAAFALVAALLERLCPVPARKKLDLWLGAAGTGVIVAVALFARSAVHSGPAFIPPIDNPSAIAGTGPRLFTALWTQILYIWKSIAPVTLSADYSYKQIPLVMGLSDPRAWAGVALVAAAILTALKWPWTRLGMGFYALTFLPAGNLLFPIGTLMAERLAYVPSLGIAALMAGLALRHRFGFVPLLLVTVLYPARTAVRNLDWRNAEVFYTRLVESSPNSSKAHYFHGAMLASTGDDEAAIAAYDRAIEIFPAYSEAFHNRGNALSRLGRYPEAMESYEQCLRFDPGHRGAASNLTSLQAGVKLSPPRKKL